MINFLELPPKLIYVGKGENAYDEYMTDDLTGINHVLDKIYGELVNLKNSEFEADPGIYMDSAYQLAIAIKLQKYPHRFLSLENIDNDFLHRLSPEETNLVTWMAYALLILRDDNSDELDEFLITFYEKMVLYSYYSSESAKRVCNILKKAEESGNTYDAVLYPKPPSAEEIKGLKFTLRSKLTDSDMEYLFNKVVMHDSQAQQALLDVVKDADCFTGDYEKMSRRIDKGDFIIFDDMFHPELPEASEEEQMEMRKECINEMNHWKKMAEFYKSRCECYEEKAKLTDMIDGAVQLGKDVELHLQDMYDEVKAEKLKSEERLTAKVNELQKKLDAANQELNRLNNHSEDKSSHSYNLDEQAFENLRMFSGCDFTLTLNNETGVICASLSNRINQLLVTMLNNILDPSMVNDKHYPGAKHMLEILVDTKEVIEVLDDKNEKEISRKLRKLDRMREQNEELYQNQKQLKKMQMNSLQGAQNVTIINGNKVERNYGDNYSLEAGASVAAAPKLEADSHQKLSNSEE